ncbi:MAG: biotin-dependent carboxyltransferase family protein [Oscillospiraceae bacterium]|nr:biotin-dependent carboxyltransferase family protein [Oscillospiraceae bacterium]
MSITVINPGMLTTVQDMGRYGYQQFGVPVSGVMDQRAAAVANILVGNSQNEAVLECTLLGPHLRFDADNCFAITGGELTASLDGMPVPTYKAISAKAGQVLRFSAPAKGCRAFIAFAGGLDIKPVMGSCSTYIKASIGGFNGRKLAKDDVIGFKAPCAELKNMGLRSISSELITHDVYTVHVVMGPQDDAFTDEGINTFLSSTYTVSAQSDRMGCRLEGDVIAHKTGGDIISDGISFGAIQVPSSGQPIIMLSDRQTTGGYTKIANVISFDLRIMAQLKPGDKIRFEKVSVKYAQDTLVTQRAALSLLDHIMNR